LFASREAERVRDQERIRQLEEEVSQLKKGQKDLEQKISEHEQIIEKLAQAFAAVQSELKTSRNKSDPRGGPVQETTVYRCSTILPPKQIKSQPDRARCQNTDRLVCRTWPTPVS
jgi:uncharacterized coiled-coil protein SlyX